MRLLFLCLLLNIFLMTQAIKHHIRNRHHNKNKSSSELKMCDLEWPGSIIIIFLI
jgi:hypothetical protein